MDIVTLLNRFIKSETMYRTKGCSMYLTLRLYTTKQMFYNSEMVPLVEPLTGTYK